jgi:nucleotide-binding universal stress UspA family protein
MKTVIAPVDFSIVTNRIITEAIKLARLLKGRVVLLHVVPAPLPIRNVLPAVEDVKLRMMSTGREAEEKLSELKRAFQRKFPAIDLVRVTGSAVACIVEQAQTLSADYIVIGSHGHSAAYDVLMGSVASGVMKKSPSPVLVVPPVTAGVKAKTRSTAAAVPA